MEAWAFAGPVQSSIRLNIKHLQGLFIHRGNKVSTIVCAACGKEKEISDKEHNRKLKKGTPFYCGRRCAAVNNNKKRTPEQKAAGVLNLLKGYDIRRHKKYRFGKIRRKLNQREPNHEISEELIEKMWNDQEGKCAFSGLSMSVPGWGERNKPNTISIDRINSDRGYLANNVQLVCYSLNLAKNNFDDSQFRGFVQLLKETP